MNIPEGNLKSSSSENISSTLPSKKNEEMERSSCLEKPPSQSAVQLTPSPASSFISETSTITAISKKTVTEKAPTVVTSDMETHITHALNQSDKQELAVSAKKEPIITTIEVANHHFLEQRIGAQVLSAAHSVVDSLNRDIIDVAPLVEKETHEREQSFLSTLPFYGNFQEESLLLEAVLHDKIGIKNFQIRRFSEGGSGSKVYGVYVPQENGTLTYVIKTMEGKPYELARELSSLQQLSDLNLHQSVLPTAQTAGKFSLAPLKTESTVFVQTAAKGKPFHLLMKELGQSKGQERQEKLETLRKGLTSAARGLAELHVKNCDKATPVGKETQEFNLRALKEVYDYVQKNIGDKRINLTSEQVVEIRKKTEEAVVGNWGMSGYSHGDSHLENLFFDSSSGQFTFIDTPSFLPSTDAKGLPMGFPAYDYAWTWGSISDKGFRSGLTSEEVESLQTTFKKEYERSIGKNLAPLQACQLAILTKYFYFITRANQHQAFLLDTKQLPAKQEEFNQLQNLIDHIVKYLKTLL
jgi:hypothetical protein